MAKFGQSIGSRLTIIPSVFVIIIVCLSAVGISRLITIDRNAEDIDAVHFPATGLLGEIDDRVSEFRLAETYRALETDPKQLKAVELLADSHRRTIEELEQQYVVLMGDEIDHVDLLAFQEAWGEYLAAHDAWVAGDPLGEVDGPAYLNSEQHRRYRRADVAIETMGEQNAALAHEEAEEVDQLIDRTVDMMVAVSIAIVLMALWLLFLARTSIIKPLASITHALTQLAAGNREITVPELDRSDEIGAMAKAFDVFRASAVALENAHAATREAQEHAHALARHDPLTGLANRRLFSSELQAGLLRAQSGAASYSIMIIDLDNFKQINDLQGHAVGDLVLCEIANRLVSVLRKQDTVARLGGDEFAIIAEIEPNASVDWSVRLAGRILATIREPIPLGDGQIQTSASMGIADAPADGINAEALLHAADIAMYRAKHDGRNTFRFFEQGMDDELRSRAALETDLRRAIAAGDIRPQYQPLIDMRDERIYGFEVLARWTHPERGPVGPDVFIPMAEQLGLISDLTTSILSQACREARSWGPDILISVNISPLQLRDMALPTQIMAILNQERFPPSRLEIEVTETALVGDIATAKHILTALQSIGIKISLDDFGTGYSSLYHLRELTFDKIKIDRSFVQSMQDNSESEKIIDAILGLAKSIGLPTVAEGIENAEVRQLLADKGCEFGQGYLMGKAMTAQKVRELLAKRSGSAKAEVEAVA